MRRGENGEEFPIRAGSPSPDLHSLIDIFRFYGILAAKADLATQLLYYTCTSIFIGLCQLPQSVVNRRFQAGQPGSAICSAFEN